MDYRRRRDTVVPFLQSQDFWEECNATEGGDLISVWPYPDTVELVDVNYGSMYSDTHPLTAFRVPTPPAFEAYDSSFVDFVPDYQATAMQRRDWLAEVARGVDAYLVAIAQYQAGQLGPASVREVISALAKEDTVLGLLLDAEL